jgi:hypothetical protein
MATLNQTTTNAIRNISQTVQEREIVKTAPDIVVFIDGLPYLLNPYLGSGVGSTSTSAPQNGVDYTLVNFNNYVQAFNATYDVDNFKPECTVNLSVPNQAKYMFQSPGGANLIESMSELQVFAKNYFPAADGNTVYTRVFKGVTAHITHTDTGKSLEISIQGSGVLRFFELMQIELNPSLMTNSENPAQPMKSNQAALDPYQQIADTFKRGISFEGFQYSSMLEQRVPDSDFSNAVKAGYINKWQPILNNIRKDVHIFGYFSGLSSLDINAISVPSAKVGKAGPQYLPISNDKIGTLLESDPSHDLYVSIIRGYLPDFSIGTINLLNSQFSSRLERIRTIAQAIGFEGYQDINGEIIIKPPLYNLDVTNTTPLPNTSATVTNPSSPNTSTVPSQATQSQISDINKKLTDQNNPFIVHLSEIRTESETEDEQGIRATRMTIQPGWDRQFMYNEGTGGLREAVYHIDIAKLAKFGLREEPPRTLAWLNSGDKFAAYAYATSELNRANRGYRTYQITIPMRPELKLGFPMFFPHRDMYGYIRSVNISYQMGGEASMSILLDTLRKRPMFPATHTLSDQTDPTTGKPKTVTIYTTQPNLVMKWTEPPSPPPSSLNQLSGQSNLDAATAFTLGQPTGTTSSDGDSCTDNPAVNLVGNPATQIASTNAPVYQEQLQVVNYRRSQLGTTWGTKVDTTTKSFRVQNDLETQALSNGVSPYGAGGQGYPASGVKPNTPFFSRDRWLAQTAALNPDGTAVINPATGQNVPTSGINAIYFDRILVEQPYTDEKGYEVVTPFPWGRWKTLPEAYSETRQGTIVPNPDSQTQAVLQGVNAFLFAGMGTPQGSLEAGGNLLDALTNLTSQVENNDSFELVPATSTGPGSESSILSTQEPDQQPNTSQYLNTNTPDQSQAAVNIFLSGAAAQSTTTSSILDNIENEMGNPVGPNA